MTNTKNVIIEYLHLFLMESNMVALPVLELLQQNCSFFLFQIWAASWQNQQNDCAPSEDSDQPGHPHSLIRLSAVYLMSS